MRILVVIANHGTKNFKYLSRLLEEYRSMQSFKVDLVVLSDAPKALGEDVEVVVGAPIKDPWSLPFGYKKIFAERASLYDLFIYSEDDTLITEKNIKAFEHATKLLPSHLIAGFIRHEIAPSGEKFYSTLHAHYYWDSKSIVEVDGFVFAHYTNEHSACFILTRGQLAKAIDSGGFMLPARKGRYDMLVTAATDPYTQCGLKKVVCISHLDEFSLHHLPNVYCGRIGLNATLAELEIERLKSIRRLEEIPGPLFKTGTLLEDASFDKLYHQKPRADVLSAIPATVRTVLSVGCGCGATEGELVKNGVKVTGVPLDYVIQVTAESRGVKVMSPDFARASEELRGQKFDCVLFLDVLHHLPDPVAAIRRFSDNVAEGGIFICSAPNFNHVSFLKRRCAPVGRFDKLPWTASYEKVGLHFTTRRKLRSWLRLANLQKVCVLDKIEPRHQWLNRSTFGGVSGFLARNIVALARKS
jgi:2-polyprenyl-3-methyl-5-hydroxy-6-metoxy-1,4-benzoquinol methylase